MKTLHLSPLLILLLLVLAACSRTTVLLEHFEVQKGAILKIPIEHSVFPYPQTNIYFTLNPPIPNHPNRDFSDIFTVEAYNAKNKIERVKAIYDVNGAGRDIQIQFEKDNPKISMVQITFNVACSGRVRITSWQPL